LTANFPTVINPPSLFRSRLMARCKKNKRGWGTILKSILFIAAVLLTLNGCSNREVYNSLQGAKQNECNKIVDNNERQRCFENANKNYDRYQQQKDAAPAK
jgi:hypothetical protein